MRLDKSLLSSGKGRQANTQKRMVDVAMEGGNVKRSPELSLEEITLAPSLETSPPTSLSSPVWPSILLSSWTLFQIPPFAC